MRWSLFWTTSTPSVWPARSTGTPRLGQTSTSRLLPASPPSSWPAACFEVGLKRQPGAALRALLEMGAKDVAVLVNGVEQRVPVESLSVGDRFVVRPGEKIATDGVVGKDLRGRRLDADR